MTPPTTSTIMNTRHRPSASDSFHWTWRAWRVVAASGQTASTGGRGTGGAKVVCRIGLRAVSVMMGARTDLTSLVFSVPPSANMHAALLALYRSARAYRSVSARLVPA